MNTKLGFLDHEPGHAPKAMSEYEAYVEVAGVQCFGTEDPGNLGPNEDEIYGFVSLFSIGVEGQDNVKTEKFGPVTNVKAGDVIFKKHPIGKVPLVSGASGFRIDVALWEEEMGGPPEDAQKGITDSIQKGLAAVGVFVAGIGAGTLNPILGAIGGAAAGLAAAMENEWVRDGVKFLTGWFAEAISDDFLGLKEFPVSADEMIHWSTQEGYNSSLKRLPELGPEAPFNVPADPENPGWLFSLGGGSYKIYLNVKVGKTTWPIAERQT